MRLKTVAIQFNGNLTILALFIVIAAFSVGCEKSEAILLIEKPTDVQDGTKTPYPPDWPHTNREPEKIIATLKPGDRVPVKGMYHGHDYEAYKVELADGTKGFIIAGDTFKVLAPKGN